MVSSRPRLIFGLKGLVQVVALKGVKGTWRGSYSWMPYIFDERVREHWVDRRDLAHLLSWKGPRGETLFEEVKIGSSVQGNQTKSSAG